MTEPKHPREYITNTVLYKFDPSSDFQKGEIVETEDGVGFIVEQDSSYESFPSGRFLVWLDRWGVQFDGCDRVKYYPTYTIKKLTPACSSGENDETITYNS